MAEMNIGESARLFADEGEYESSTRNNAVMSDEGKCVVKLEVIYERAASNSQRCLENRECLT